jgi:hypothetical protein
MKNYLYDPITREFLREEGALASPLEPGVFPLPANMTRTPPPAAMPQKRAVWNGKDWVMVEDHRGTIVYNKTTLEVSIMSSLGPIPASVTSVAPPSSFYSWKGSGWVLDRAKALAEIRMQRDGKLSACDYTQLADVPMSDKLRQAWKTYRQQLRNFLDTCDPANPVWPTPPEE